MFWPMFILSPVDGHHGGFHFGTIMNVVGINTCVRFSFRQMFSFMLCKYLGAEFLGQIAAPFKCLRNCHGSPEWLYQFPSPPPQQCTKAPVFPHPAPQLLLSVSKIRAMPLREMGYWVMVFICSSLMTGEGQTSFHVFIDHLDVFSGEMSS